VRPFNQLISISFSSGLNSGSPVTSSAFFFRQCCGKSVRQTDFEPRLKIGSAVGQDPVGDMELNWRCDQFAGDGLPRRVCIPIRDHRVDSWLTAFVVRNVI
jgi:hypothetical protein